MAWHDMKKILASPRTEAQAREERYFAQKIRDNDKYNPGWRNQKHPNGQPAYSPDGTMLDENGNRSIFDDVDE